MPLQPANYSLNSNYPLKTFYNIPYEYRGREWLYTSERVLLYNNSGFFFNAVTKKGLENIESKYRRNIPEIKEIIRKFFTKDCGVFYMRYQFRNMRDAEKAHSKLHGIYVLGNFTIEDRWFFPNQPYVIYLDVAIGSITFWKSTSIKHIYDFAKILIEEGVEFIYLNIPFKTERTYQKYLHEKYKEY